MCTLLKIYYAISHDVNNRSIREKARTNKIYPKDITFTEKMIGKMLFYHRIYVFVRTYIYIYI